VDQSPGAARERLLLAFPGRGVSGRRNDALTFRPLSSDENAGRVSVEEEDSGVCGLTAPAPERSCSVFNSSSAEYESSTKFESHSNSAISSYCLISTKIQTENSVSFHNQLIITEIIENINEIIFNLSSITVNLS
jgi:hypothetical protein